MTLQCWLLVLKDHCLWGKRFHVMSSCIRNYLTILVSTDGRYFVHNTAFFWSYTVDWHQSMPIITVCWFWTSHIIFFIVMPILGSTTILSALMSYKKDGNSHHTDNQMIRIVFCLYGLCIWIDVYMSWVIHSATSFRRHGSNDPNTATIWQIQHTVMM